MIKYIAKNKYQILSVLFTFILFLLYNNKLFLNISTALSDWFDYPLMVYILQENIKHISSLDFANLRNFSMYYNTPGGMYFTDLLLPQSIIGLVIYPLFENYITTHNVVFFIVGLLNIISLQYFWSKIFKDKKIIFLLTLLFTFSPYVFTMYAHYQMVSYWFFFFSLGKLIGAKNSKDYLIAGLLSGLQFLAAVYIGIYSITISAIYFLWKLLERINLKDLLQRRILKIFKKITDPKILTPIIKNGLLFLLGFTIIAGYFVFKFYQVQKTYNIQRPADEYVNHSMQITDFLFNPLPSLWVESFYKQINVHNHRLGGETFGTGFILLSVSLFGAYQLKKTKLNKKENYVKGFILLMFFWGLIAILGPRLSINGKYLAVPLPYILPLKLTPFFSALRVISRWFFIVQIGLLYFVGFAISFVINKFSLKKALLIIGITLVLYAVEIVPIKQRTKVETYKNYSYDFLIENCKEDQVVLEYPFAPEQPKTHVLVTLNYWTKMILNLMHYDCQLVNGYSGFQPKHIDNFIHNFRIAVENSDDTSVRDLIKEKDLTYIKFNKSMMIDDSITNVKNQFITSNYTVLLNDNKYLLVMVK